MNDTQTQTASGSVDPLALLVVNELRKSGTRAWLGFPPPEEMEKFRAEKAERDFQTMKRRADRGQRHLQELKQAAKRKLQGETDYE